MIVFNLGQAKSGSTFVYQLLTNLRIRSGSSVMQAYYKDLDENAFADILQRHRATELMIVKCHSGMNDGLRRLVSDGSAVIVATFRDPRDTAMAQLDAGVRDRNKAVSSLFATFYTVTDVIPELRYQLSQIREILDEAIEVLSIPYFALATSQDFVIRQVCDYIGLPGLSDEMIARWRSNKASGKIGQYNRGIANRFATDMAIDDLRIVNDALHDEARYIDQKTREALVGTEFAEVFDLECQRRDEILSKRLDG